MSIYDIIIIGGGAAGLTAGIYGSRAGMKTLIIEKMFTGGQAATTFEIDNYPGFRETISGPDLMMNMEAQAKRFGAEVTYDDVKDLQLEGKVKKIITDGKVYESKSVILALGAHPKELGLEKERTLRGAGVSYCATCDGAFYKDRVTAVAGGGNTAVEDAIYLSRFSPKVYLIHRRDSLRADKVLQDIAFKNEKIEFVWDSTIEEIIGEQNVEGIKLKNIKTDETKELSVEGIFVAIGYVPNSSLLKDKVELDNFGYIITGEDMSTNVKGVFSAGDIRQKTLRQVITSAGDGATAAYSAQRYVTENS